MTFASPPDHAALAGIVADEMVRNGVGTAVYCPGSRNGAVGFALSRLAEAGRIRLHVRLDERSAAFVALGVAKSGAGPAAVVTTSGSAVANLLPAVTEASYSRLPLVVLTANRPVEALGTGASQTVEQLTLLASQLRHVQQVAPGGGGPAAVNAMVRSQVCRAVALGCGRIHGRPGPVQVDLPLDSSAPTGNHPTDPAPPNPDPALTAGRAGREPWIATPARARAEPVAVSVDLGRPTIVVAGDGADLADVPTSVPCVPEPTARADDRPRRHPWVLDYLEPAQVILAGRPTLHRNMSALLARPGVEVFQLGDGADDWIYAAPHVDVLQPRLTYEGTVDTAWSKDVARVDAIMVSAWGEALGHGGHVRTGVALARELLSCVGPGDLLYLGASNPVRDVSLVGPTPRGVEVLSGRGVAGIDGNLSAAVGAALARPDRRVIALIGDLTFAHDCAALQFGRLEQIPTNLIVVVANDGGGGIFEILEQGHERYRGPEYGDAFERLYGTPQAIDIGLLCRAYGAHHQGCQVDGLPAALAAAPLGRELSVVEVATARGPLRSLHHHARSLATRAVADSADSADSRATAGAATGHTG